MDKSLLKELLDKYASESLSGIERDLLCQVLDDPKQAEMMQALLEESFMSSQYSIPETPGRAQRLTVLMRERMEKENGRPPVRSISFPRSWLLYAASVLVLVCAGVYFLGPDRRSVKKLVAVKPARAVIRDITPPSTTHAVITLADGRQVVLDSANQGPLAQQGDVRVTKQPDGEIRYSGSAKEIIYNTLTNPRGSRVVNIVFSDGTHVWLNAASSLSYPIAFTGKERRVKITGEAYFEVEPDAKMPFVVEKAGTTVKVLGTHFNVNAYDDEKDLKVTLLEGSVKVAGGNDESILIPGQQALVAEHIKVLNKVDISEVMAWKNDLFKFNKTNIEELMRQVARWYDVEVEYQWRSADLSFEGVISRRENVSALLKVLEATEAVHFAVEGRKIIVMK